MVQIIFLVKGVRSFKNKGNHIELAVSSFQCAVIDIKFYRNFYILYFFEPTCISRMMLSLRRTLVHQSFYLTEIV